MLESRATHAARVFGNTAHLYGAVRSLECALTSVGEKEERTCVCVIVFVRTCMLVLAHSHACLRILTRVRMHARARLCVCWRRKGRVESGRMGESKAGSARASGTVVQRRKKVWEAYSVQLKYREGRQSAFAREYLAWNIDGVGGQS
eukprot:5189822-Pleurochrysis_carterae.AAC.3